MICPKCSKKNPESGKFCVHCGADLDQAHVCPECKATYNEGDKFCIRCGTKLSQKPVIRSDIQPEIKSRAEPMNLDFLQNELTKAGWRDLRSGQHLGFDFELVGHRGYYLEKYYVLVKVLPILDQQTAVVWKTIYNDLNKRTKSIWVGKIFILCLIAQDVVEGAQQLLSSDHYGYMRGKGGAGFILIADINKKAVYGELTSPISRLRKEWNSVKEILSGFLNMDTSPPHEDLALEKYTLTIKASHGGNIVPPKGTYEHEQGTVIHISAIPDKNSQFVGWIGDVTDAYSETTAVNMTANKIVTASFAAKS